MKTTSLHKKFLRFVNLDVIDQFFVLLRFFIPALFIGGIVQFCLLKQNYNITGVIITIFILILFFLALPSEKIEIISEKDKYIRPVKMLLNIVLGAIYFSIITFATAMLLFYIGQVAEFDKSTLFCLRFALGMMCFVLAVLLVLWKFKKQLFLRLPEIMYKGEHILYLESEDFSQVNTNHKNIEFRLCDIKRRRIKVGNFLKLFNIDNLQEFIYTEVTKLYYADNFAELLSQIEINKTGYNNIRGALSQLNQIYTLNRQQRRKVIAIEFKKLQTYGDTQE